MPDGGLVLDSEHQKLMISRSHAQLQHADGKWKVRDVGSTNGLLVNGVKRSEAVLQDGDIVTFGGARGCEIDQRPGAKVHLLTRSFACCVSPAPRTVCADACSM